MGPRSTHCTCVGPSLARHSRPVKFVSATHSSPAGLHRQGLIGRLELHGLLIQRVFQVEAQVFQHYDLVEVVVGLGGEFYTGTVRPLPLQTLHHAIAYVQAKVVVFHHVLGFPTPGGLIAGAKLRLQVKRLESERRHVLRQKRKVHPRAAHIRCIGTVLAGVLGLDDLARHLVALSVRDADA